MAPTALISAWLHRRLAWLALCALAFGAFAPHATSLRAAVQDDTTWVQICGIDGTRQIALQLDTSGDPDDSRAASGTCGYCVLQHHTPVVPERTFSWTAPTFDRDGLSPGAGHSPLLERFARIAPPPRAPPAFS